MKTYLIYAVAGICALATGYLVQQHTPAATQTQTTTNTLPEFSFPDFNGQHRSSKEWAGKILVINFWATWCAPCREEMPEFIQLQEQLSSQNVQFIGIAIDNQQAVESFITTLNINYPILISEDAGIELAYQSGNILNTVPFTLIVNPAAEIVHRQSGSFSTEALLNVIDSIK